MSDPDNFLTRWSRRKRATPDSAPPQHEREQCAPEVSPADRVADAAAPAPPTEIKTTAPVFDLSKLPSIDSITAETDIRAFFAPGIPADLKLAALRRAWVADPKVRDFVGLADYDFDFHTPGAIPGFGPLEMTDDLRREVVRIVTGWQAKPEPTGSVTAHGPDAAEQPDVSPVQPTAAIEEINAQPACATPAAAEDPGAGTDQPHPDQDEVIGNKATAPRHEASAASQQQHSPPENLQTLARRGHGRALPK